MPRRELVLTSALIGLCLALTGLSLWPRLGVQRTPIVVEQPDITVAVAGAVTRPGSYTLPWGSRLQDAVQAAGGFALGADQNLVNLAAPLGAGEAVFVPERQTAAGTERVSINSASLAELDTLPGVGPAIAGRIIEGRPYASIEDLLAVRGIGPATLEKLRPFVTL